MSSYVPSQCPAFQPTSARDRAAEGAAVIEARQVLTLAALSLLSWMVLLAPFFICT